MTVTRDRISETEQLIRPYIRRTPTIEVDPQDFNVQAGAFHIKLEFTQYAGSFKSRGAFASLLLRDVPDTGVVAASGGNHGAAVAYAAARLGYPANIFVPNVSSPAKKVQIESYGANLIVTGERYADALTASEEFVATNHALSVHAYDQTETLLGQGTTGLELESQVANFDTLLVSVGGGGFIGGIAAWFQDRVKVVGVEPDQSPTLHRALAAGEPVDAPAGGIAADSLAPRRVGELMFPIADEHVDSVVLVSDDAIKQAQIEIWRLLRIVVEPGAAAAMAALMSGQYQPAKDERIVTILCGANVTAVDFGYAPGE